MARRLVLHLADAFSSSLALQQLTPKVDTLKQRPATDAAATASAARGPLPGLLLARRSRRSRRRCNLLPLLQLLLLLLLEQRNYPLRITRPPLRPLFPRTTQLQPLKEPLNSMLRNIRVGQVPRSNIEATPSNEEALVVDKRVFALVVGG